MLKEASSKRRVRRPQATVVSYATTRHIAAPVLVVHEDSYYSCQNKRLSPCARHFAGYGLQDSSSVPSLQFNWQRRLTPVREAVIRLTRLTTGQDASDMQQTKLVRQHLRDIQTQFLKGDFSGPSHVHGKRMPGLAELHSATPGQISITAAPKPAASGGIPRTAKLVPFA